MNTPPERAIVALRWSTSGRSAAPAVTSAPNTTEATGSGCRPNVNGTVDVTATQAAAPLIA